MCCELRALSITHKSFPNRSSSFGISLFLCVAFFSLHFFFFLNRCFLIRRAYNSRILPCVSAALALHCTQQRPRVVVSSFHSFVRSFGLPYTCTVMITRESERREKKQVNSRNGMKRREETREQNKTHTTYFNVYKCGASEKKNAFRSTLKLVEYV